EQDPPGRVGGGDYPAPAAAGRATGGGALSMWRCRAVFALCMGLAAVVGAAAAHELNAEEAAGQRIYRNGLSTSGGEIHARVGAGGTLLPASALPCAGCHGTDGRGRLEGGVAPPD